MEMHNTAQLHSAASASESPQNNSGGLTTDDIKGTKSDVWKDIKWFFVNMLLKFLQQNISLFIHNLKKVS